MEENPTGDDDGNAEVTLPSGAPFHVHESEVHYFNERVNRYTQDYALQNVSDLQDLDRIIMAELQVWRWNKWMMQGRNYWGDPIDEPSLQRFIKDLGVEIRNTKSSMGMDKVSRDRQKGQDSVADYIANLRRRAHLFGYKRNEELYKVLEIFHDLKAMVTLYRNTTDDERLEQKIPNVDEHGDIDLVPLSAESVLNWFADLKVPEFVEIDRKFRQDGEEPQKIWIVDQ